MLSPTKVKIGRYYDVPCIRDPAGVYVPIIGPSHCDGPELCLKEFTQQHYHYDYRFMPKFMALSGIIDSGQEVVYRRKKCISTVSDNGVALWGMIRLARMYQHHTIDVNNPVCPHQNIPIVNKSGKCSGHGLCWNMKTGKLKYELPFYIRFKNTKYKVLVTDRKIIGLMNTTTEIFANPIVQIIDRLRRIVGSYQFKDADVRPGDTLKIKTGCLGNADATNKEHILGP